MKRPIVLLDCDGVLSDFTGAFCSAMNERIWDPALHVKREDVTAYHYGDCPKLAGHPLAISHAWERAKSPKFCEGIKVLEGAREGVKMLSELADVLIVTSPMPSPTWCYERTGWLWEHFGIDRKKIIFAADKEHVLGHTLVDDHPSHVEGWEARHDRAAFLWERPYNEATPHPRRTSRWEHVHDHLLLLELAAR